MTTLAVLGSLAAILGIVLLLWSTIAGNRESARAHEALEWSINERGVSIERSVNERVDGVERSVGDLHTEMLHGFGVLSKQIAGLRNPPGEGSAADHDDGGESAPPAAAPAPAGDAPD